MKYLITDPCYLLPLVGDDAKSDEIWSKFCDALDSNSSDPAEILSKDLGVNILAVSETGFGDWSNQIESCDFSKVTIYEDEFGADSGMMCIVEVNDKLESYIENHHDRIIGALFKADVEGIEVYIDETDPNWYVMKVMDSVTGKDLVQTMELEFDDDDYDEDDDYYDDYDDDEDNEY